MPLPELSAGQPPPDHYYADNLIALIEGVRQQYGDILTPEESAFGEGVVAMPAEAQRLLARLISRKGPLVRVDSLSFREIADTPAALTHLVDRGYVSWCPEAPAADLARLLTRAELAQCFGGATVNGDAAPVVATDNGSHAETLAEDSERCAESPPRRASASKNGSRAETPAGDSERCVESPPRRATASKNGSRAETPAEDSERCVESPPRRATASKNGSRAETPAEDSERCVESPPRRANASKNGSDAETPAGDSERCAESPPRANARKREYLEWIGRSLADSEVHRRIERPFPWVALDVNMGQRLELYRLLFFGDRHRDLSTFVLRDLGLARYPEYALARERRLFADRVSLDAYVALIGVGDYVDELGSRPPADAAASALEALWSPHAHRLFERRRSRILNRLGRGLERVREFDLALACYARSSMAPARERRTRILKRLNDPDAVERLRRRIRARPLCPQEADFAARFGTRRRSVWPEETIDLEVSNVDRVEAAAAEALTAGGGCAWHLENALPMGLFGLAYWDWMFAPVDGMFVNAFQAAPIDLFWPDFFEARRGLCADPLETDDATLRGCMREACRRHRDVANRLVDWRVFDSDTLGRLLDGLGMDAVRKLLAIASEDLQNARRGFPDLTVVHGPGRFEFVEVKGPNDRLRGDQYLWIDRLRAADLPVRVARCR